MNDIKHWTRLFGACLILAGVFSILEANGVTLSWWHPVLVGAGVGFLVSGS